MILGIGTDLVYIPRMAETYERQGERFLNRCFAPEEIDYILASAQPEMRAARMAKRWAAKEAYGKALGCGIADTVTLKDICVLHDAAQKPYLRLCSGAKTQLESLAGAGMKPVVHLSLSDDGDYAQAFVVLDAEKD